MVKAGCPFNPWQAVTYLGRRYWKQDVVFYEAAAENYFEDAAVCLGMTEA